jgi:peptide/nickel transport system permease protein
LSRSAVIIKHALRDAPGPIITVLGLQTGLLLGGAVLTERIVAWPAVGRYAFDPFDAVADPRIRYGS